MNNSTHSEPRVQLPDAPEAGFITSPISAPEGHLSDKEGAWHVSVNIPDDLAGLDAVGELNFPSAALIGVAAGLFPPRVGGAPIAHTGAAEGVRTFLEIGPGIIRVRRTDVERKYRTEVARRERQMRDELLGVDTYVTKGTRQSVTGWSRDSRARLIADILERDLSALLDEGRWPGIVTLTYPGDWRAVCSGSAEAAEHFHRFTRLYERRWGKLQCIWKREFQKRGAPHWHLWMVPPEDRATFLTWLSETWTEVLFGWVEARRAIGHHAAMRAETGKPCVCSESCRSLSAGTALDYAKGLRAKDPKRLAIYFLKESGIGESKAYQNDPPADWAGESVGRYWGVRGIPKSVATVELEPEAGVKLVRAVRRWQKSKPVYAEVMVQRGWKVDGTPRMRKVRRKSARQIGPAGWVAVNDGPAMASVFAPVVAEITRAVEKDRDLFYGSHLHRNGVAVAVGAEKPSAGR